MEKSVPGCGSDQVTKTTAKLEIECASGFKLVAVILTFALHQLGCLPSLIRFAHRRNRHSKDH
jgi:hypothetical protein